MAPVWPVANQRAELNGAMHCVYCGATMVYLGWSPFDQLDWYECPFCRAGCAEAQTEEHWYPKEVNT